MSFHIHCPKHESIIWSVKFCWYSMLFQSVFLPSSLFVSTVFTYAVSWALKIWLFAFASQMYQWDFTIYVIFASSELVQHFEHPPWSTASSVYKMVVPFCASSEPLQHFQLPTRSRASFQLYSIHVFVQILHILHIFC